MKKYLLTVLTTIVIVPIVSNAASETDIFIKNNKSNISVSNNDELKNQSAITADGIDWNYIQKTIDKAIDNPKELMSIINHSNHTTMNDIPYLTTQQKNYTKTQASQYIDKFKKLNFTKASEITNYLETDNKDFKDYYNDPTKGASNINEKILFQYFNNKIDLNLDGANTYQDVVNTLINKIQTQYSNVDNLKVSLVDEKLANQTLFNDNDSNSILSFVNDQIAIPVNVQFGNNKAQEEKIQLKNITLSQDSQLDNKWLVEAVSSYFDQSNPQNINFTLSDTRQMAFDKVLAKIKDRFPNYDNKIKLSLVNSSAASEAFYNNDIINEVANENSWLGVNIASENVNKNLVFALNFNLNYLDMNNLINQLYLTGSSEKNLQDLNLTTDNTYKDVIDSFNQRLKRLDSQDNFSIYLQDTSQASTKIQDQYKPDKENQSYEIKVGFQVKVDKDTVIKLGETSLYLTNVALGKEAQDIKKAYDDLKELVNKITLAQNIVDTTAVVLGIAAAAFWASAYFFGITTSWAIACSIATSVLGSASAAMSIAMYSYHQKLASLWQGAVLLWKINRLGLWLGLVIYGVVNGVNTVLTATSWANFGLALTGVSALLLIYSWIEYYNKNHQA